MTSMDTNRLYKLHLNLPGILLPYIHFGFTTAGVIWFLNAVIVGQDTQETIFYVVAIIVGISGGVAHWWWKILTGPIKIEVLNNEEACLTNLFGYKTKVLLAQIELIQINYILIRIKSGNEEFITSNYYRDFDKFVSDVKKENPSLFVAN